MPNLSCRAVSKVQEHQTALHHSKQPPGYKLREGRKTRSRQRNLKRREVNTDARSLSAPAEQYHISDGTHAGYSISRVCVSVCRCVSVYVSEKNCPAPGLSDVDCNQEHMTLLQEVLQRRTGSRNTGTTSLVSLVSKPTANRSLGHGGHGRSCWCVHNYVHVLYVSICVSGACRLVLMTYLFTEYNESRLCVFSRVRAELWQGWACRQNTGIK